MSSQAHRHAPSRVAPAAMLALLPEQTWQRPTPNAALMRVLGVVNRWLLLRGYCRIRRIDLPADDRARLEGAVNPGTAAFLAPNHPEFGADWLIDKELSTLVAPRMASWASSGIVNAAPRFWGMNNLVANDGGTAAKCYSVEYALAGDGVLLHPEGSVRWTNDRVHALFPGVAQMAMAAAQCAERPVFIVPLVWKYRFIGDVSARLHREMRVIERALGLASPSSSIGVGVRFYTLQMNLLAARMRDFSYEDECPDADFFTRQDAFRMHLVRVLTALYRVEASGSMDRMLARIRGVILSAAKDPHLRRQHLAMVEEAKRLGEMSRDVYGTPLLTQEQMAECLKRTRDRLMRRGWRNVIGNMLPCPLGARVVHVAVPEPIRVVAVRPQERAEYEGALLDLTRESMQAALDGINRRIAPSVEARAVQNPLVR